jgi:hypothetical protein
VTLGRKPCVAGEDGMYTGMLISSLIDLVELVTAGPKNAAPAPPKPDNLTERLPGFLLEFGTVFFQGPTAAKSDTR